MLIKNLKIRFKEWDCLLGIDTYAISERIALLLVDAEDYEPIATATVNIPEVNLAEGEIIIKNYSENEGMVDALVKANVIHPTNRLVPCGYTVADVCKFTDKFYNMLRDGNG